MNAPAKAPLSCAMPPIRTAALAVLVAVEEPERVAVPDAFELVPALPVAVAVADEGNTDAAEANNSALEYVTQFDEAGTRGW